MEEREATLHSDLDAVEWQLRAKLDLLLNDVYVWRDDETGTVHVQRETSRKSGSRVRGTAKRTQQPSTVHRVPAHR
jgi:hypothetical protein